MIAFNTLDELKVFLRQDRGQQSFSPVRFINVDSLNDQIELKNFLATLTTNFISLSGYCADDTFPNLRRLRNDLLHERRDVCVLPLSEFLRVNPEQAALEVNRFLNLRNGDTYSFRIYFLMYRMKKFFLSLQVDDPRQRECVLLSTNGATDDYSLTIIQKFMPFEVSCGRVDGFKSYFQYWEESPGLSLTLYTQNAVYLKDKNFFDDVKVIANAFDLLRQKYSLPAELKRSFGEEDDWNRLARLVTDSGNFERALCKTLEFNEFNLSSLRNFGERNKFQRWLLWLRCKIHRCGYAARCAKASSSAQDFTAQIYELILSCSEEKSFDELCNERRELLATMKILPSESFIERIRQADKHLALKVLTNHSHAERLLIFETLRKFKFNEFNAARRILQQTFPDLAKYLSNAGNKIFSTEQAEYFRHYRRLKVTNQLTRDFNRRVKEIARDNRKKIYDMPSRNQLVANDYSQDAAIFFVDGLGAEYLNFLVEDFATLTEKFSVAYHVARCNLPSVTENNKDFLDGRNIVGEILELDSLKHNNRAYPENILGELDFLTTLKEKILTALNSFDKVILCSDHGTSRLAVLARKTQFDSAFPADGRAVYKSGRFADSHAGDDKNFSTALELDGKIIFADYSRFSQKGATGCELHGGATWEEVLVPVVAIEKKKF